MISCKRVKSRFGYEQLVFFACCILPIIFQARLALTCVASNVDSTMDDPRAILYVTNNKISMLLFCFPAGNKAKKRNTWIYSRGFFLLGLIFAVIYELFEASLLKLWLLFCLLVFLSFFFSKHHSHRFFATFPFFPASNFHHFYFNFFFFFAVTSFFFVFSA